MKKLAIAAGILVLLFIIAAIAVPFVVDVDKFRPQVVQAVNDHINGEFKLGKMQLSLWGGIRVKIESLSVRANGAPKPLLETTSAYLEVPFLSLLRMHPQVIVVLAEPKVDVIKGSDGKLNVMALMRASGAPAPPPAAQAAPSAGIPAIAASASLGFRIDKGIFRYADEAAGNKIIIDGVNLDVKNLGLNQTVQISLQLPLKGNMSSAELDGSLVANAQITPAFSGGAVQGASGRLEVDGTALKLSVNRGMIQKSSKTPLLFTVEFSASPNDVQIKSLDFKFDHLEMAANGQVTLQPKQAVKMDIHSTQLNLASLEKIVPMLKEYQLGGAAGITVHAEGPFSELAVHGDLDVKGGKAAYPAMLKSPIAYALRTSFTRNSLNLVSLDASAPGTDVNLKGTVQNFAAPQFNFTLNSKEIDVDKLLKTEAAPPKKSAGLFPIKWIDEAEAAAVKSKTKAKKSPAASKIAPAAPVANTGNPMLPLAKNPMVADAAGTFTANIGKLTAKGAPITALQAKFSLKKMVLTIETLSMKAFEGTLSAKAVASLGAPGLNFNSSGNLKNLSAKAAITAFVPKFQNTLEGTTSANWSMTGAAYPQPQLMHSLNGTVTISAVNGRLRTIDLQDSIKGVMAKLPLLKGQNPPPIDENFKSMRADMKFAGGVIDVNPLEIVGQLTIKGKSKILENMTQDTYVDVFDPNKILPKEISDGKDAAMSLHVTGPLTSPQTDYGYTAGKLAKNVIKNKGSEMIGDQLKKAMGGSNVPGGDKAQDAVKGVLKGLGF